MSVPDAELDALLRSMRDVEVPADALPDGALAELRRGVRARIRRSRQRRVLAWCASAAATVAVGVMSMPLWQALPQLDARAPRMAAVELAWQRSVVLRTEPALHISKRTHALPALEASARPRFEAAAPGFIRVLTRDPSVVVLWAMDEIKVEEEAEKNEKKGETR